MLLVVLIFYDYESHKLPNCAVLKLINKQQTNLEITKIGLCISSDNVVEMVVVLVLSSGDIFGGQGSAKSWPVPDTK